MFCNKFNQSFTWHSCLHILFCFLVWCTISHITLLSLILMKGFILNWICSHLKKDSKICSLFKFNQHQALKKFIVVHKCNDEVFTKFVQNFRFYPSFISWKQHHNLLEEIDNRTLLTKKTYQTSHFDQVIFDYREIEFPLSSWVRISDFDFVPFKWTEFIIHSCSRLIILQQSGSLFEYFLSFSLIMDFNSSLLFWWQTGDVPLSIWYTLASNSSYSWSEWERFHWTTHWQCESK